MQNDSVKDFSYIKLKPDHERFCMWIGADGQDNLIFLEAFSPDYKNATDFLVAIAEPVSRPQHIHEYRLTKYSLYAAASIGLTNDIIEEVLMRYCKNLKIPSAVSEFIQTHCSSYGKAKVVLKNNQYFIEASDEFTIKRLVSFPCIQQGIRNREEQEREAIRRAKANAERDKADLSSYGVGRNIETIIKERQM